jgi:RNA polymerase sigma-70 factor (ECF subfamily)
MDDREIVDKLKGGDDDVYPIIVEKYQRLVLNCSYRFVRNRESAEDLTQEVFMEVFESIHSFRGESRLSTWIYRIAVTKSLNHLKSQKRKKRFAALVSLFGRRPPKDEPAVKRQRVGVEKEEAPDGSIMRDTKGGSPPNRAVEKPAPASIDEKLAKYTKRLGLTDDQAKKIRSVMLTAKQKDGELRMRAHPDPNEIQTEKERIRKEEDDGIMELLGEEQGNEFRRMTSKRRR